MSENELGDIIHILLVEDDEDDYLLTKDMLEHIPGVRFHLTWEPSYTAALAKLRSNDYDVLLVDYWLGAHTGLELLNEVAAFQAGLPVIIVTGTGNRDVDMAAMHAGATDYLVKGQYTSETLERSIRYAVSQKKLQRKLTLANEELEQFAYIASHDLQEPLHVVTSYLQLIDERYGSKLDVKGKGYVSHALDGTTRMRRLIDDLLALSRLGSNKRIFTPLDVSLTVKMAIENLQFTIEETDAKVTYDALPSLIGDQNQLVQLFQNLISNGLKFQRPKVPPQVHISAQREGYDWIFEVRDNGIGIEEQYFTTIFKAFHRLHGRTQYEGTGIGLSLCKKIVERHGGRIWVDSEVGNGTTFFFNIPIRSDQH